MFWYLEFTCGTGPQERDDVCTTCGLGSLHCPGHMGHIVLPLPVYNPVLFRTMFQVCVSTFCSKKPTHLDMSRQTYWIINMTVIM